MASRQYIILILFDIVTGMLIVRGLVLNDFWVTIFTLAMFVLGCILTTL